MSLLSPRVWKRLGLLVGLVLVLSAVDRGEVAQSAPERFLVFTTGAPGVNQDVRSAVARAGGNTLDEIRVAPGLEFLVVRTPGTALSDLARRPGVREVSPEIAPIPLDNPADWGVKRIDAECVWGTPCEPGIGSGSSVHLTGSATGSGVVVAITDTGVQPDHLDLSANLAR